MSLQTQRSTVSRLQRELADLQRKVADEQGKVASKQRQIGDLQRSITSTTSASTLGSKMRQLEGYSKDLGDCQKRVADAQKRVADKQDQLHRAQGDLAKEEERETKRQSDADAKRRRELEDYQRAVNRELSTQRHLVDVGSVRTVGGMVARPEEVYDVFVCHASEDKDGFVRPLVEALQEHGVRVWYDEHALQVGDSLRRSIDKGLAKSRFGIVVLSTSFFAKNWTQYELDGLVSKEMIGNKVVLPIWHKVSVDEVRGYSPTLADRVALNSALMSVQEIASKVVEVVQGD
jgi:uncharacterized protein YeeX (DUF496 family)